MIQHSDKAQTSCAAAREHTIQFDGISGGAFGQQGEDEHTPAGADLQHGALRSVTQRLDDAPGRRIVTRKCCPSFGFCLVLCAVLRPWHVDPKTSGAQID